MPDDLRRSAANLLGTVATIGAALGVVFGLKSIQVAIYGPVTAPTPVVIRVEVTVQVTATPRPAQAEAVNLTPTHSGGDWSGTEPRPTLTVQPTRRATLIPGLVSTTVDFAGNIPDTEKYIVIVERANGTRRRYILPKNVAVEFTNSVILGPNDVVIGSYPLLELAYTGPSGNEAATAPTPLVQEIVDLAEGLPDEAVFVYIVRSEVGAYTQYLVPKEQIRTVAARTLLGLSAEQQIIRTAYLAGLPPRLAEATVEDPHPAQLSCAKFDPALCRRLPTLEPDERVAVAIWLTAIDYGLLYDFVAAQYPATIQPRRHLPFDPAHPDYDRASAEVETLIPQAYALRAAPMLVFLGGVGVDETEVSTWAPVITAALPPEALLYLAEWRDVVSIELLK